MGYAIRRLVVPCLLSNFPIALFEHRLFSKLMKVRIFNDLCVCTSLTY